MTNPATWGKNETMITVLFPYNEKAIAISDLGELYYCKLPEEYVFPGSVLPISESDPVSNLPENEVKDIQKIADVILGRYSLE